MVGVAAWIVSALSPIEKSLVCKIKPRNMKLSLLIILVLLGTVNSVSQRKSKGKAEHCTACLEKHRSQRLLQVIDCHYILYQTSDNHRIGESAVAATHKTCTVDNGQETSLQCVALYLTPQVKSQLITMYLLSGSNVMLVDRIDHRTPLRLAIIT